MRAGAGAFLEGMSDEMALTLFDFGEDFCKSAQKIGSKTSYTNVKVTTEGKKRNSVKKLYTRKSKLRPDKSGDLAGIRLASPLFW